MILVTFRDILGGILVQLVHSPTPLPPPSNMAVMGEWEIFTRNGGGEPIMGGGGVGFIMEGMGNV